MSKHKPHFLATECTLTKRRDIREIRESWDGVFKTVKQITTGERFEVMLSFVNSGDTREITNDMILHQLLNLEIHKL